MSTENKDFVDKDCSVRVAVRIRPQNSREKIDMCRMCVTVNPQEPQVILGLDKAFTFDYVFDVSTQQNEIYSSCVERLVEGALGGYNATVLAYGQTGSGKTYTMGTGFEHENTEQFRGIIPRAVHHIFSAIEEKQSEICCEGSSKQSASFNVAVQFLELYNEDIKDLLDPFNNKNGLKIHENATGQICISGLTIKPVTNATDAIQYLRQGILARTTASTKLNDQSSRSHAVFTILIRQERVVTASENISILDTDLETLTSKFHFVDLAGSERLKRTGATGERAREGISINSGLLCLGNCISALGDKTKRATHVPYRDSKLTRLLQDSLGGNSQTVVIACISPSDRDFMETLNTLKYANRARNIKNKLQINQDQSSRVISRLRAEIAALQLELIEYKQGKRAVDSEGNCSFTDEFYENAMLKSELKRQEQKIKALKETIKNLTEQSAKYKLIIDSNNWNDCDSESFVAGLVTGYINEIEELKAKLIESEKMYQELKKDSRINYDVCSELNTQTYIDDPEVLITKAKREIEKEREMLNSKSLSEFAEEEDNSNICEKNISDDEESISELGEKGAEMQNDLSDINADIEIKTKLIEELERSHQRMEIMKSRYEEKFTVLKDKIANTEKERDEVLGNIETQRDSESNGKVNKLKDEYEKKIDVLRGELKKLQQAQKEHSKQRREMKAQEAQLNKLRKEVADLKHVKVQLMRKMNEQSNRYKETESRKMREIAQLRKEHRKQLCTVKTLQTQMEVKERVLRRKTEEVNALRRNNRSSLNEKNAGIMRTKVINGCSGFRSAHFQWAKFSRGLSNLARKKFMLVQLEKEMQRLVSERESLSQKLLSYKKMQIDSNNPDLISDEDTIKTNLNYIQENITQVQQTIMEFEEGKSLNNDTLQDVQSLIEEIRGMDEAKYIIEQLSDDKIGLSCNLSQNQNRILELETLLKEAEQENSIQNQLIQHFLNQSDTVQITDLFNSFHLASKQNEKKLNGSENSLNSNETYDIPSEEIILDSNTSKGLGSSRSPSPEVAIDLGCDKIAKIRKRAANPNELLFGDGKNNYNKILLSTRSEQLQPCRNMKNNTKF